MTDEQKVVEQRLVASRDLIATWEVDALLIGSPANLILLGALDIFQVPGREEITFFNWFVWAVPLVAMLLAAAWIIVARLMAPKAERAGAALPVVDGCEVLTARQQSAMRMFLVFFVFWVANAVFPVINLFFYILLQNVYKYWLFGF